MRSKDVADGQQVEIPVLQHDRTVGTHVESGSREREDRYKRGRSCEGKPAQQSEAVMWSERKVAKSVSHVPRKAAIVHVVPVP